MCVGAHAVTCVWRVEGNLRELVLSLDHMGPWDLTKVVRAWQHATFPAVPSHRSRECLRSPRILSSVNTKQQQNSDTVHIQKQKQNKQQLELEGWVVICLKGAAVKLPAHRFYGNNKNHLEVELLSLVAERKQPLIMFCIQDSSRVKRSTVLMGDCEPTCTNDLLSRGCLLDRRNIVPDECSEMQEGMKSNTNDNWLNVSKY